MKLFIILAIHGIFCFWLGRKTRRKTEHHGDAKDVSLEMLEKYRRGDVNLIEELHRCPKSVQRGFLKELADYRERLDECG